MGHYVLTVELFREDYRADCLRIAAENYDHTMALNLDRELSDMFSNSSFPPRFFVLKADGEVRGFGCYTISWMDFKGIDALIKIKSIGDVVYGLKYIFVRGCIIYRSFNKFRHTAFCAYFKSGEGQDIYLSPLRMCDEGNDVN